MSVGTPVAGAASPLVVETWATDVAGSSAKLSAQLDPNGAVASYRFEYLTVAAYEANEAQGKDSFFGASRAPAVDKSIGLSPQKVVQEVRELKPETSYRYRVFVRNSSESVFGPEHVITTSGFGGALELLDGRGWEMVSPVDKNGGAIQGFGGNSGGGVLQAAGGGSAVTFSSTSSFGGGDGAPAASQYISRRTAGGWSIENITAPLFSGGYGDEPDGVPYQLFSPSLAKGLLSAPPYPPLPGSGAPAGYRNYYLRDSASGAFEALLTHADVAALPLAPSKLELEFAGSSPDLLHVVLSTCAALTPDATEVPDGGGGCDSAKANLYQSQGAGLKLVNRLPGAPLGSPGARLAAPSGAVASDGARVYWTFGGDLYLREGGGSTAPVDESVGGGGVFQTAAADGSPAFFTKEGHLYRYDVETEAASDLTPLGGVEGVLGASATGAHVYYLTPSGLFLNHDGVDTPVAAAADISNVPPSTGTARVTPDGVHLAFVSAAKLTGYDNTDKETGKPDSQIYLYDANLEELVCASCNPTNGRPSGPSSIPGAVANGLGESATRIYKPRALAADGRRLFFDSSDKLVVQDSNGDPDVYEWEAQGAGSCLKPGGCVQLISGGRVGAASFVDASADGADVFFLTDDSLLPFDPGSVDLYDAREGGGFPEPPQRSPCEGDSCQPLPSPPDDPVPGTLVPNPGNAPPHFRKPSGKKPKHKKRHRQRRRHR